ncbi:MFS transporter [Chloroflexi bacterium]|nr:MFS transporter [Chloroflexota bacterium]
MNQSSKNQNTIPETLSDQNPASKFRVSNMLDALSYRDFRWVWIGSFVSFMAMNMQMITRSWLILRVTDDSPLALSLVTLTFALPMTVVAPFAGALADRFSRKKLIIFSQIGSGLFTLFLGTLDFIGVVNFWHIMLIGIFNGSLMSINMPSRQAIISDIVPDSKLMNAISLNFSSMNLTRVAGPALAGFLILLLDTSGVFFVIAVIYAFAAITIGMVHYSPNRETKTGKNVGRDVLDGIRYVFTTPSLRGLFIMSFIPVIFGFSFMALIPAWAKEALAIESDGLGILLMLMGIGATIGTLILSSIGNIPRRGMVMLGASLTWGISLAIFAQITSFSVAIPFLIFIGLTSSMYMSLNMTMMQTKADPEMRGRTMSIAMMTFGMMPLSAVPFGTIAEKIGTADSLTISGILLAVFTIGFAIINKTFRKMD